MTRLLKKLINLRKKTELFDISQKMFKEKYPNNCRVNTENFSTKIKIGTEIQPEDKNNIINWLKKFDNILSLASFSKNDEKKVKLLKEALRKLIL